MLRKQCVKRSCRKRSIDSNSQNTALTSAMVFQSKKRSVHFVDEALCCMQKLATRDRRSRPAIAAFKERSAYTVLQIAQSSAECRLSYSQSFCCAAQAPMSSHNNRPSKISKIEAHDVPHLLMGHQIGALLVLRRRKEN